MKKFLSLLMTSLLCVTAWAGTYEYNLNSSAPGTWSDWSENTTSCTADNFTFTIVKGSGGSTDNMLQSGHIRLYNGSTFTIASSNETITKIVLTYVSANDYNANPSIDGNTIERDGSTVTWTGSAQSVTASFSAQARFKSIAITTEAASSEFSLSVTPAAGEYNAPVQFQVVANNAIEGCVINYTLDPYPETTYSEPFMLYKTCTIEVNAVNGDGAEATWSGTYTINLPALEMNVTPGAGSYRSAQNVTVEAVNGYPDLLTSYHYEFTPSNGGQAVTGLNDPTIAITESGELHIWMSETESERSAEQVLTYVIDPNLPLEKFELVTSVDQLEDGKNYIILNKAGDAAMGAIANNKGTKATGYTLEEDVVTLNDGSDVMVFTLGVNSTATTTDVTYTLSNNGTKMILGNNTNITMGVGSDLSITIDDEHGATIRTTDTNVNRAILYQIRNNNGNDTGLFGNYSLNNRTNDYAADYSDVNLYVQLEEDEPIEIEVAITPEGGTYYQPQTITITTDPELGTLADAFSLMYQITYAGSETEGEWKPYTGPFTLSKSALVTAMVFDGDLEPYEGCLGVEEEYEIVTPVITLNPAGGTYYRNQNVTATCDPMPEGAKLLYSIWDDEEEEFIVNGEEYTNGITIDQTCELYVWLVLADGTQLASTTVIEDYEISYPEITLTPDFGTYETAQNVKVTVTPMPEDAVITYILDPVQATAMMAPAEETEYTDAGIDITKTSNLTVLVSDANGDAYATVTGEYVINDAQTAIEGITTGKSVKSVRYYNVAGQAISEQGKGVNIVVVEHADGTTTTSKVVK